MSSRPAQVFAIPELLENILIYLPMRDLLLAQSISRTFHTAIHNIPSLQEKLFFRARRVRAGDNDKIRDVNPMLHPDHAPWFNATLYVAHGPGQSVVSLKASEDNCLIRLEDRPDNSNKRLQSFLRKEASWRRMLPTQPPPKSVWLVQKALDAMDLVWMLPVPGPAELLRERDDKPIRMAQVYNTARLWSQHLDSCQELYPYHVDIYLVCCSDVERDKAQLATMTLTRMETRFVDS